MKTKYKYIHFEKINENDADSDAEWDCKNNKSKCVLGIIEYYGRWKQYVFEAYGDCVFNVDCLNDIVDFMKQLPRKAKTK